MKKNKEKDKEKRIEWETYFSPEGRSIRVVELAAACAKDRRRSTTPEWVWMVWDNEGPSLQFQLISFFLFPSHSLSSFSLPSFLFLTPIL